MNRTADNIRITIEALKLFGVNVDVVKFAPGDGWTRYSVAVNGWHDIHNGMTAAECHAYLSGMFDMLRVQQSAKREQSQPSTVSNDDGGRTAAGNAYSSDGADAEALLGKAQQAQTAFWHAVNDLERAANLEIDSTRDLSDCTLADLSD